MSDYYNIGRLVATFGIKGELVLRHSLGRKTAMNGLETVFIEEKRMSCCPIL